MAQYEKDLLTVVIPAHNEEGNIPRVVASLQAALRAAGIRYQIIIVDDNSADGTRAAVEAIGREDAGVELVVRTPPPGFGRAVRAGLDRMRGDVVAVFMADDSDDPADLVRCHEIIRQGYDCVFGSRFAKGSSTSHYPPLKLVINRIVNQALRVLFMTRHNDLTNAFKLYRAHVIDACRPYRACHFNITLEMSLGALIRRYSIASAPISWSGRTWGSTKLRLREMGRRYLHTILVMFLTRTLVADDLPHKGDGEEDA